jgi:alkylation response protein AidB-like acyl-CoA dehydrogenase
MNKNGLLDLTLPRRYGGKEADVIVMGILVEEFARAGWQIPLSDTMTEIFALQGSEQS